MNKIIWEGNARCAVSMTFDVDGETLWISKDPANEKRTGVLSQGAYGPKVGVPLILDLLERLVIESQTVGIPGISGTDQLGNLLLFFLEQQKQRSHGHEIGLSLPAVVSAHHYRRTLVAEKTDGFKRRLDPLGERHRSLLQGGVGVRSHQDFGAS